jgi:hypothetical protein
VVFDQRFRAAREHADDSVVCNHLPTATRYTEKS